MNATSKTFFKNNIIKLEEEFENIEKKLHEYAEEHNITSHMLGDPTYYKLSIERWSKYRQVRLYTAILRGSEYSFINHELPVIKNKISFCRNCLRELEGAGK